MEPDRRPARIVLGAPTVVALALAFTGIVAANLLWRGPFAWHVQQPAAWQGGLEAIALSALLFLALQKRAWPLPLRLAAFFVPVALYLRRHNVDAVLPVVLLYLEAIALFGLVLLRWLREDMARSDVWLRSLVAGIAALSLVLWTAQAFDLGALRAQRTLALVLLLPVLLWQWRHLQSLALLRSAFSLERPSERLWAALLIATPLVLFARSNVAFGFDESWYGLRPDRVLVGVSSVFEPLGLVAPVYYYPKLYEVLLLPLSATREYSAVQGMTILLGGAIAKLAYDMLRRLGHARVVALAGAAVAWSLPALAAASVSVKPDVAIGLFIVAMVWFGWNLLGDGRRADLGWIFACAGLAFSSKLTALPYIGSIGVACLVALMLARAGGPSDRSGQRAAWAVLAMATAVGIFVCARTYLLAGMPTVAPDELVAAWRFLGMEFIPPVGTLTWTKPQVWADVPVILLHWVSHPSAFSHLQISWPGNVWLFLPVLALLLPSAGSPPPSRFPRWLLWVAPAAALAMLILIRFLNRGGDGNYFIAPAVLATIAGVDLLWRRARVPPRAFMLAMLLFVGLHSALSFVSGSWSLGTRAWDLDFSRPNRDTPRMLADSLQYARLTGVAAWLKEQGGALRLTGDGIPLLPGYRLPARVEFLNDMLITQDDYNHPDPLVRLMACAGIEAMLLPVGPPPRSPYAAVRQVVALANALPPSLERYRDADWRIVWIKDVLPACDAAPK